MPADDVCDTGTARYLRGHPINVIPIPALHLGPIRANLISRKCCMWDMIRCIVFALLGIYLYYEYSFLFIDYYVGTYWVYVLSIVVLRKKHACILQTLILPVFCLLLIGVLAACVLLRRSQTSYYIFEGFLSLSCFST